MKQMTLINIPNLSITKCMHVFYQSLRGRNTTLNTTIKGVEYKSLNLTQQECSQKKLKYDLIIKHRYMEDTFVLEKKSEL